MTSHAYITINLFNLCQHFFLPFYTYFLKCWHRLNEPYMVRCGYIFHNKYVNIVNVLSNLFVWEGYRFCLFLQFILCGRDIDFVSFYNLFCVGGISILSLSTILILDFGIFWQCGIFYFSFYSLHV